MQNETISYAGLLVVRRINWFTDMPVDNPIKHPANRLPTVLYSHEELRTRYRGFDGWAWPEITSVGSPSLDCGLADLRQNSVVEAYYREVSKAYPCDLLYLDFSDRVPSALTAADLGFSFLGYDYGYYLSEHNYFSSLFHEVIYGLHNDMKEYAKFLNDNLLFTSIEIVRRLDDTRTRLLRSAADLERDEPCAAVSVYGHASPAT